MINHRVVIDASVVGSFLFSKTTSIVEFCTNLFTAVQKKQITAYAPSFFWIEIANVIRFAQKDHHQQTQLLDTVYSLGIKSIDIDKQLVEAALERSDLVNDSVYDALYHVTAHSVDAVFLTCDKKYFQKAEKYGGIELVE